MKEASRSKKAIINTECELLLEVVSAICSFILPRLILTHFGSAYNGITSSITQFISCVALLKSGIGSVTRAALYKPLAEQDRVGISEVVNATSGFMRRIALVFTGAVLVFAGIYPFIIGKDFDWIFTFTLVIILSLSTFAQYFFGLTYQMVLQADQRNYIISIVSIFQVIANTAVASALILMGFGIHIVKLGSAIVFMIPPLFYNIYVRKQYQIIKTVKPNYDLISQRWDAFGHQVANFINNNTDIIVTTIFLGVTEVSVYTIYAMVGTAIKKAVNAIGAGTTAAFGNMIAKNEKIILGLRFKQFELFIYFISTILLTVSAIMIGPFVRVYTKGVEDVNYVRPILGYLFCISIYFTCIKLPYEQIVFAAGKFKQTRNGAFTEAFINIILSVVLVNVIGLDGIIIGTIVAIAYRTIRYHLFVCDNIIANSKLSIVLKFLYSFLVLIITFFASKILPLDTINSYLSWCIDASIVSAFTIIIASAVGIILFRKDMVGVYQLLLGFLKRFKNR